MFWYVKYKFSYEEQSSLAIEKLKNTACKDKWNRLVTKFNSNKIKIYHKLPPMFYNSWNPIFVGKFNDSSTGSELVGYFRVHWYMIIFLTICFYQVYETLSLPEVRPGYVEGWKSNRLNFDLTFLAFALLINIGGWLFRLPNQNKVLNAIEESRNDV